MDSLMKRLIEKFPQQLMTAIELGQSAALRNSDTNLLQVVVAGMGGSGIGGNLIEAFTANELTVPLLITKSYELPFYVNEHTLFLACSYSGNTEETIQTLQAAIRQRAHIVCICSGGDIMSIAKKHDLDIIEIPGHDKSPRANIGYAFTQILFTLYHHGLISNLFIKELAQAAQLIEQEQESILKEAKTIADCFTHQFPIIYSDAKLFPVAVRFQQQINENSKQLCHVNAFPEMNHNELVGWELSQEIYKHAVVAFFKTDFDHARVRLRMDICKKLFQEKVKNVINIQAKGTSFIQQNIYLIHLTDWVSYFLAENNKVDPFPVKIIDFLKAELLKK